MTVAPVSALVVRVPEAEPLVADLRARHDPSAADGLPAHITILVPFLPPAAITPPDLERLRRLFARVEPFDFALAEVRRWPLTVWLEPQPAAPFVALVQAVVAAFPAYRPYEGRHPEVVPHLSVADGDADGAAAVELELRRRLQAPLPCRCREVELIDDRSGRFECRQRFGLGRQR